jgi:quinol monooxygenase YgiN
VGAGGQLASVRTWRCCLAAAFGLLVVLAGRQAERELVAELDFTPAAGGSVPEPAFEIGPEEGPVMVTLEYQIDPARAADFAAVMERTRRARLRQGALSWGLFRDTAVPGRYVEYFVDENWVEHQRRLERFTAFDAGLRAQRLAFHVGEGRRCCAATWPTSSSSGPRCPVSARCGALGQNPRGRPTSPTPRQLFP